MITAQKPARSRRMVTLDEFEARRSYPLDDSGKRACFSGPRRNRPLYYYGRNYAQGEKHTRNIATAPERAGGHDRAVSESSQTGMINEPSNSCPSSIRRDNRPP